MARQKILLVEDEADILELVRYNLAKEGYDVEGVTSGEEALKIAPTIIPDLVILDLMLPGVEGLEVCSILKSNPKTEQIPVVILTAKTEEADIVKGLELGADDYITKPFSPKILIARVKTVLRRRTKGMLKEDDIIQIQEISIHPGRHEVFIHDRLVELTYTEFRILHFLARRPGWVFTRNQIMDAARGEDYVATDRSVDVQIAGLRKKLKEASKYIETVRGIGYRFKEM